MNPTIAYRRSAFILGLALIAGPGHLRVAVSAQTTGACALLTSDEIEAVAVKSSVASGVSNALPGYGYGACRYSWGTGTGRFTLEVVVTDPARMFPGMSPDQIKQRLLESVRPDTSDSVIAEVGDAAVFKPDSPVYASATALIKGRVLQVHLDGAYAGEKKDQIVGLLKSAAARL
jgi:hypothetical protein